MVARNGHDIPFLDDVTYAEHRLAHPYTEPFGLVAARHDTTVIVAQHNDSATTQVGIESPLTANEKIITVGQSYHTANLLRFFRLSIGRISFFY